MVAVASLNTPLRDTGASITVLTSEFLKDLGAIGLADATAYAVNIHFDASEGPNKDENPAMFNYDATRVKILVVAATVTRNYFRWELQSDAFLSYRLRTPRGFLKNGVNLQLNVKNVLDDTDLRVTTWLSEGVTVRSAVVVPPRSWRFTAGIEF